MLAALSKTIKGINTAGQALHPPLGGFRGKPRGIKPFVSSLARSCPCKHGRDLAPFVNKKMYVRLGLHISDIHEKVFFAHAAVSL
jgi:hypothetical protein